MSIYVPNLAEKDLLKAILKARALRLGLYKNVLSSDGGLLFVSVEGLTVVGGYAVKDLVNDLTESALTASKWYVSTNASGKAEAQYSNAAQEWTFTSANTVLGETAYGVYAWSLILAFTAGGTTEIKVGDTIANLASAPTTTAIVTMVDVRSGTWGGDNAAGYLCLKTQAGTLGTFAAGSIFVGAVDVATIAGDSDKILVFIEPFTVEQEIDTEGQKIAYTPKMTLSTA